ncbi:MAG: 5-formyltetrahydrofolate cyclo-ligase [Lachnospiraceae bacterium]|nr:5-formyltetrahydrofolate cyclo-ligase [Lachnospiraceae bacterium]
MNMDERIKRINELYHKSQKEGLSPEEKAEQKKLRDEYIASIRNGLRAQLDNIDIKEKDGSITNLGEKYGNRKNELRKEALKKRASLSYEYMSEASEKITEKLTGLKEYKSAQNIFLYASVQGEADTKALTDRCIKDGKAVFFPKCRVSDAGNELDFYRVNDPSADLIKGYKDIPEPDSEKLSKYDGDPDIIVVPGVCFDSELNRMGHGKGFYDRFLNGKKVLKIGLCFEELLLPHVFNDDFDVKMDMVITEQRIITDE